MDRREPWARVRLGFVSSCEEPLGTATLPQAGVASRSRRARVAGPPM